MIVTIIVRVHAIVWMLVVNKPVIITNVEWAIIASTLLAEPILPLAERIQQEAYLPPFFLLIHLVIQTQVALLPTLLAIPTPLAQRVQRALIPLIHVLLKMTSLPATPLVLH